MESIQHHSTLRFYLAVSLIGFVLGVLPCQASAQPKLQNVFKTLQADENFKTLVAALQEAGMAEVLKQEGPFTLFAPLDSAFANLPKGMVEELLKPENKEKLKSILAYHVVTEPLVLRQVKATSIQGSSLRIQTAGPLLVNNAKIVGADRAATNGIIYAIDTVLMPDTNKANEAAEARRLIQIAIERGVPLFNDGEVEACKSLYEVTVLNLSNLSPEILPPQANERLRASLQQVRKTQDLREQAWILRRALDAAAVSIQSNEVKDRSAISNTLLIDDFTSANGRSSIGGQWRLFTDRVMGGVSTATSLYDEIKGRKCLRLKGDVSLENNGGFVQVALDLQNERGSFDASMYKGIRILACGNNQSYYIHLRSNQTMLPWQYFSAPFKAGEEWKQIDIPFESFTPQNLRPALNAAALKRIAIVGAKKAFTADVAVARIELYR